MAVQILRNWKLKALFFLQCEEYIPPGDETIHILGHYVNCHSDKMHRCLRNWMQDHRYFVENVGGNLIRCKGLDVSDYMHNVVQPQMPLDEIGLLLYARMYKIHLCVILEGKYWCTNRDDALNKATIHMIYKGHMMFDDTTRKGSLHSSMFEDIDGGKYQLRSHGPIDEQKFVAGTRTTLNSMHAGLVDKKQLAQAKHDYEKINRPTAAPKHKKTTPKAQLNVKVHGIPVRSRHQRDLKCPVCRNIYHMVKDLNEHIKEKHLKFRYKC